MTARRRTAQWIAGATVAAALPVLADGQRTLRLLAPSADDRQLAAQQAILATDPSGLAERDVVVEVATGRSAPPRFEARLIGKDGGEKLRSAEPLGLATLYAVIDAMPMRRAEKARAAQR